MRLVLPEGPADLALYAKCLAAARGNHGDARTRAEGVGNARVADLLRIPNLGAQLKDLVASGSTAGLSAPLREYLQIANSFLEWSRSALDVMLPAMQSVRLGFTRFTIVTIGAGSGGTAEGAAKAVSSVSLDADDLPILKAILLFVTSEELLRMEMPQGLFAAEVRNGIAAETDRVLLSRIVDTSTPAIAASGSTAAAFLADLSAAVAALSISARSRLFLIVDPLTAATLALMPDGSGGLAFPDVSAEAGGLIGGVQIVPSGGIQRDTSGPTSLVLVDAAKLAAAGGSIIVDASAQASIEMETSPANSPSAATVFQSLWQQNKVGFRAERYFAVARLRDSAVATITGASYGA
jgi:HK97 family phage major capsid protein